MTCTCSVRVALSGHHCHVIVLRTLDKGPQSITAPPRSTHTPPQRHTSHSAAAAASSRAHQPRAGAHAMSFGGEVADAYQRIFESNVPAFEAVLAAVRRDLTSLGCASPDGAGLRVLDLASGPGEPATTLARALPGASVTCSDVAEDMVAKAKARARVRHKREAPVSPDARRLDQARSDALPNLSFAVLDAADLSAYPDASFDVVSCVYGIMFVPDAAKALREVARVLAPTGRAYLIFWRRLEIMRPLAAVMRELTGREPAPPPINPLHFAQDDALMALLPDARLRVEGSHELRYEFHLGNDAQLAFLQGTIPIAASLAALKAEGAQDVRQRAKDAWLRSCGFRRADGCFVVPGNVATMLSLVHA